MRRKVVLMVVVTLTSILIGCTGVEKVSGDEVKQIIEVYNEGNEGGRATTTWDKLHIVDENNKETVYNMPEDEFYVSIAPYINYTHPWKNHNLTGCQGELSNEDMKVTIIDKSGKVIKEEMMNTAGNGFIDLWLPRDEVYDVTIEFAGRQVTSEVETSKGSSTCITTMQLV